MVTSITSAATTATTSATSSSSSTGSVISSDFQTFLVMLTTQMQNQDPLNPIESTEYATQLATFSGVEQAVQTNDLLKDLATQLSSIGMSQLAGWVGMEARSDAPAYFDGSNSVTLAPQAVTGSDRSVLVVRDSTGAVVQRGDVDISGGTLTWSGTGADGATASPGLYTFEMESYQNGVIARTDPVESYSEITEARIAGTGTVLVLRGGSEIGTSDATALRQPE
ncbi:flagellar hook capping FlgD N-terminal domain-containing protein [Albirhodobacter sp. R86504]|jgi:flagellar basal-body rod modification protein FlgD|uniref:flagellar hook capping FlgD N-terminal domain-containing protein n=1 Tax=Albirhodobacter sp. R86504 TaxID=3093848 RepID=UPI0036700F06